MGLFDWLSRQTDTKNRFTPTNFGDTQQYNSNDFNYGGYAGGARDAANAAGINQADAINQQQGYARNSGDLLNVGMGNLAQQDAARAQQQQAAGLMMQRATGQVPSIAGMQAQQDMQRAVAAQQSGLASARGPAGLALAQGNANANVAQAQQGISGQAQINSANERLAAEQAAMGAYSGIRQGDQGAANAAFAAGASYGGLGAQYGNLGLGYGQLQHGIQESAMQGSIERQRTLAGSHDMGQQIGSGVGRENAGTNMTFVGGVAKAGEGGIGAIMGRASGGPVDAGQPYLVGEQGPELVLPSGLMPRMAVNATPGGMGSLRFGGAYSSGADQLGAGGGVSSNFGTSYQNNELRGMTRNMGQISYRADGGPVEPGRTYVVGEQGPEIVLRNELNQAQNGEQQRLRDITSFKRDTPEDQARIRAAVHAQAARDADAMLAGYKRSLNAGASVAPVMEIDREPAPWLAAYMAQQEQPKGLMAMRQMIGGGAASDAEAQRIQAALASAHPRAVGGPMSPGSAYLVGEQGPELVVPQSSGTVIPAPQTRGLLGMTPRPGQPDFGGRGGLTGAR